MIIVILFFFNKFRSQETSSTVKVEWGDLKRWMLTQAHIQFA